MTANRLAQLGTRAVVLEQGSEERYLCNTRYTGGTFHVCLRDIMLEETHTEGRDLERDRRVRQRDLGGHRSRAKVGAWCAGCRTRVCVS